MSQAIGDPDELERFAHALHCFIEKQNDAVGELNGHFNSLGDTWQDVKRSQFEEEYRELLRQLASFESHASEQVPYLLAMASRLRDYLQS